MSSRLAVAAAGGALLLAQPAFAHHPSAVSGAAGAGPLNTISATTLDKGQSAFGSVYEFIHFGGLSDAALIAGAQLSGDHDHSIKTIESVAITYAYGVTTDLTVSVRLPWIRRTGIREAEIEDPAEPPEIFDRGDNSGIGDLTLLSQYRFYNDRTTRTEAAVLLGVKAPTGVTDRRTNQGELFDAEFQPGSGSWDGLFGLAYTKRFGQWSFDANVLYMLVTNGTQDTDLGDRFLYNAAISYRLTRGASDMVPMKLGALPDPMWHGGPGHTHSHHEEPAQGPALDLVLELNGEWHAKEVESGVKDPNSGGNTLYLAPGLRFSKDNWSSFVSVGFPIFNDLNGIQSEPDIRVVTGLSVSF
jgi:Putative MetA-pathway of phenol degradation